MALYTQLSNDRILTFSVTILIYSLQSKMGHDEDLRKYELKNIIFYRVSHYHLKAIPFWKIGNTFRRFKEEFFYISLREYLTIK